jgi:iron(III) transport system substrate-binding protein
MQVQSSAIRRRSSRRERAVMADGNGTTVHREGEGHTGRDRLRDRGIAADRRANGLFKNAPNPNAARLFRLLLLAEAQQLATSAAVAAASVMEA